MRIESGRPSALAEMIGSWLPAYGCNSVKHCGSELKMMKRGYVGEPQIFAPFAWMAGYCWYAYVHASPEKLRLNIPAYMSYQRYTSSVELAMLFRRPCELSPPAGPFVRLMVGEIISCMTSRNAVNRVSPAFSPSSWLPTVSTRPPMLQMRAGELDGPQRSLYVRFESCSTWTYSAGGLPVVRHTSRPVRPPGSGNRLSIEFAPEFSAPSKL